MNARLTSYKIQKVGYYRSNNKKHCFYNIDEMIYDLERWVKGEYPKTLGETKITDAVTDSNQEDTYIYDVCKRNNDFLLVTWNKNETIYNGAVFANETKNVGDSDVKKSSPGSNYIPGYPGFYWILPQENKLVNVLFEGSTKTGKGNCDRYFIDFLYYHSRHVRHLPLTENNRDSQDDLNTNNVIFVDNEGKTRTDVSPVYKSFAEKDKANLDYIQNNISKIYKIIKKSKVETNIDQKVKRIFGLTFFGRDNSDKVINNYKIELDTRIDSQEFNKIYEEWKSNYQLISHDIGFKMSKDDKTYWLSHSEKKYEIDINHNIYYYLENADKLLELLQTDCYNLV